MIAEKIQNIITQEKRNIVFFFDADHSLHEELPEIAANNIKVIEVKKNYFELKYQLEFELNDTNVFLYHPFAKPNGAELKKYPLLDLLKANAELKLDDASEFLSEYQLPEYHLTLVKKYIKQLKTKTHQKKLARILDAAHFSESNLKLGLISVVLGFNSVVDRNSCVAKWISTVSDTKGFNKISKALIELELEGDLLNWLNALLDTNSKKLDEEFAIDAICKIKYNILTSYINKPAKEDSYVKLKLERTSDINRLQAFFEDWKNHPNLKSSIEPLFNQFAKAIKSSAILKWYGSQQEFGYYSEDMLSTIILGLYGEVEKNSVKTKDDCINWLRSSSLDEDLKKQFSFLYHTASVYAVLDSYRSFQFNKVEDYITQYTQELYKVDLNYRKAMIVFDQVRDRLYDFEEKATTVFNTLNSKYDRFLIEFNVEWQKSLNGIKFNFHQIEAEKQFDFYNNNIKGNNHKTVVIISDALRYELGFELYNDLLADSKNNVSIEPCLASIPSYTNLGMSNLLPNSGITVEKGDADLVFKINEKTTVSTNREKILQMSEPESATLDFTQLKKMSKNEKRAFFKDYRVTYIYHDWIDVIGDKKRTEYETFEATTKAIEDIKWMIRNISGELGIAHVYVTSDHGFLFNHTELQESSREVLPKAKGYNRDHVRFVVSDEFEGKVDGYKMNMKDTTNIDTDLQIAVPRAINRYRKQGNVGVQFVHGGASVQELLTPVVKFYKNKKELLQVVTFKRIDQTDKITSGSLKITLLQDQPVSNESKSAEVIFGLYSDTGELFSNEVKVHFNSTSSNPRERMFDVILTLNSVGSNASFCYLKAFDQQDKAKLNPLGSNDLIKISSLMEIDEF